MDNYVYTSPNDGMGWVVLFGILLFILIIFVVMFVLFIFFIYKIVKKFFLAKSSHGNYINNKGQEQWQNTNQNWNNSNFNQGRRNKF